MPSRRTPHAQLKLALKPRFGHGGARAGAGRKNLTGLQAHVKRPRLSPREPLHVTLRLVDGLPSIRRKDGFRSLREAVGTARKKGFGVVHYAILSNHLHLILEPSGPSIRGQMQSFSIAFARR